MLSATSLADGEFVAVDIETTGCRPGTSAIIEIGAVLLRGSRIVDRFETLVRPGERIPHAIRFLTGIDDEMVADAPEVAFVMAQLREFVGDAVLVAHNHRFDMGFLDYEAERAWGTSFARPVLDTLSLSRRLHPEIERHNLRALALFYGVDAVPTHRAPADALATAQILEKMLPELASRGFTTAEDVARFCGLPGQGALASKLVLSTHLPDGPGVYLFRDAAGAVIYVGRAKNLRMRVRSLFYGPSDGDHPRPASEVASVDHYSCVSILDTVLLESRLLDRYRPRFNSDHERGRTPVYIRVGGSAAFPTLVATARRSKTGTVIGPLTNLWAAETLVEALRQRYGLRQCSRRLTASMASCVDGLAAGCPHPCDGGIGSEEYARRVEAALAVFDGDDVRFRTATKALRERAAAEQHYEDAIVHRDAVRALDRTLSALCVVRAAAAEPGAAIVECIDDTVVVFLIRHGGLGSVLRLSRADVVSRAFSSTLKRAISRTYSPLRMAERQLDMTARQLRDLFIIDTYRRQHKPTEIAYTGDDTQFARRISAAVRRAIRVPRKSHAAPSVD